MPGVYLSEREFPIFTRKNTQSSESVEPISEQPEPTPSLVTDGLMVHYDFSDLTCYSGNGANGAITDLSGNAVNTNYTSPSDMSFDASDYDGAFIFSPTADPGNANSKIDLVDGMSIPPYSAAPYYGANPTFTLDFWIKPRTRNPALSGGYTILGSANAAGAGRLTIQAIVPPTAGTAYFRVNKGAFGINTADFQSYYTFTAGTPINVTFTKTGFVYELYVNGQFKASVTDGASTTYNVGYQCLGQNWNPGAGIGQKSVEKFDGSMYTMLGYNRVLTSAEVLQNYNSRKARFGL